MSQAFDVFNTMPAENAEAALLHCCAAGRWAHGLTILRPFADPDTLCAAADRIWSTMEEADWMEAFRAHPRIGERKAAHATAQSAQWSQQEQASTDAAEQNVLDALARCNARYEEQFGFTYIVCATGKSSNEMLRILERRLISDRQSELQEAAEQQRQIMQIRLRKWLSI
jgi:2-oxo-4-hydroxy-4-carboxy-5-ureidoimidazoline decarboxylase